MLCIIGNMPTYVTNLHRLTRIILSAKLREFYANDFVCSYRGDRRVFFTN